MVLTKALFVTFQDYECSRSHGTCRGHHPSLVPVELSRVLMQFSLFPCRLGICNLWILK